MASVFDKLNLKQQREILVIGAPTSFEPQVAALDGIVVIRDVAQAATVGFALAFVTRQGEVDALAQVLAAKAPGDPLLWFAYPKATSKRFRCEFNRDTGWAALRSAGLDTVRQVAIDDDWSALRFRRVAFISARP